MIEFGKTLRAAREAKGYTISQLAEMTRMIHQVVEDLENENFSRIAAPIYGRGFVKLYCEAVGIDQTALIAEFMAIYNGKRELGIKEREIKAPKSAPQPESEREIAVRETVGETEEPSAPPPVNPIRESAASPSPSARSLFDEMPPPPAESERPAGKSAAPQKFARYASPLREMNMPSISLPPAIWRLAVLATAALIVLYLIFAGFRALHRATTPQNEAGETAVEQMPSVPQDTQAVNPADGEQKENESRKSTKVPPLYID
jgi:cytoskeletal protein RodZ